MTTVHTMERPIEDTLSSMRISESDQGERALIAIHSSALTSAAENTQMQGGYNDSSVPRVSVVCMDLCFCA